MSAEREIAAEDSIRVVCRFRPLNDSEEKAGSKVIVKFPNTTEENCISIAVSIVNNIIFYYMWVCVCVGGRGRVCNASERFMYEMGKLCVREIESVCVYMVCVLP